MKTDRELLELAARAAGLNVKRIQERFSTSGHLEVIIKDAFSWSWNSLDDSTDAFRLAVNLGIGTIHHQGWGQVFHPDIKDRIDFEYGSDKLAATRRAITQAAAEIQLQKERER